MTLGVGDARCRAGPIAIAAVWLIALGSSACAVAPPDDCSAKASCDARPALPEITSPMSDATDAAAASDARNARNEGDSPSAPDAGEVDVAADAVGAPSDDGGATPVIDTIAAACRLGYECAAPLPPGWWGPLALWWSNTNDAPPPCPAGYEKPVDMGNDLLAPPATCASSCTAMGQQCSASVSVYADSSCVAECGDDSSVSNATCTAVTGCSGTQGSLRADAPVPTGGTCAPSVRAIVAPPTWASPVRMCVAVGPSTLGLCPKANAPCVATPAVPYTGLPCIVFVPPQGQPVPTTCPSGYPFGPSVYYTSIADSRACSAPTCAGVPTGGDCAGTIAATGAAASDCSTGAFTYAIGSGCSQPIKLTSPIAHLRASMTVTPGSCSVGTEARPVGAARAAGSPNVICCM
jgi:hypothetical protein